jgi:hypothetical protein
MTSPSGLTTVMLNCPPAWPHPQARCRGELIIRTLQGGFLGRRSVKLTPDGVDVVGLSLGRRALKLKAAAATVVTRLAHGTARRSLRLRLLNDQDY